MNFKEGQTIRLGTGEIAKIISYIEGAIRPIHLDIGGSYTADGKFHMGQDSMFDIVEILEEEMNVFEKEKIN